MIVRWLALLVFSLAMLGCEKETEADLDENYRELLLLKVADSTYRFEGGARYAFPDAGPRGDTLPLRVDCLLGYDIGHLTLTHAPTATVVFDASILWNGQGQRRVPEQIDEAGGYKVGPAVGMPSSIKWLSTGIDSTGTPWREIWEGVASLHIVGRFVSEGALVGLVLYRPGEGPTAGMGREWYWVMYR